jgi:S1-C subfamily serine protease
MHAFKARFTGTVVVALIFSVTPSGAGLQSHEGALGQPFPDSAYSLQNPRASETLSAAAVHGAESFDPRRLNAVLSALEPDRVSTRGAAESRLYSKSAPGVVLIATKDSLGSGSVISPKGLVLTNLHVVGNGSVVTVVFKPSVEGAAITKADAHRGTVVRRDEITDLALVQVADPPPDLTTIPLGHLADVSVGSDVHAIGHPTGEAWSYTKGIVSQVRRNYSWQTEDRLNHTAAVIQTQTPINPGNSGGPLLTDKGDLVGVNSFKSQGEGLNFAVSVDDVRVLLSEKRDRMITASSSTKSTCIPKSYGVQRLKDGSGTVELLDLDCFGKPDAQWILPDDPTEAARLEVDPNHTGHVTGIFFSKGRDGKWDYSIWDTTGSGKPDLRCVHQDGGPIPTRCEKIAN